MEFKNLREHVEAIERSDRRQIAEDRRYELKKRIQRELIIHDKHCPACRRYSPYQIKYTVLEPIGFICKQCESDTKKDVGNLDWFLEWCKIDNTQFYQLCDHAKLQQYKSDCHCRGCSIHAYKLKLKELEDAKRA